MNNWSPYAPDFNPPPGIPQGYPYALNPSAPPINPMHPNLQMNPSSNISGNFPNYPSVGLNPSPAGLVDLNSSYAAGGSPYPPENSGYPFMGGNSPYPTAAGGSYPTAAGGAYPTAAGGSYPTAAGGAYPTAAGGSYPTATGGTYPTAVAECYPTAAGGSYPTAAGGSYPTAAGGSYPIATGGSYRNAAGGSYTTVIGRTYPAAAGGSYPTAAGGSHPTAAEGSYPNATRGSPYPTTGSKSYPPSGLSPYPSGSSPYPASGASPHPTSNLVQSNVCPQSTNQIHFNRGYPSGNYQPNMAGHIASEGTVKPYQNFDPKVDAEVLRKAMKGFGTDEKAIINVLANRSNSQRVYISIAFKQLYGKDLIDDLKSELSGNFERVILGLMLPLNDYLASELHNAISGLGTNEEVLIEILCTRTNQEIWTINEAYRRLYGKNLEDDIKSDTSGHFQRLLVSTCTGARSEAPADGMRAKETAEALYQAGAGQWGTDESMFNSILVAESFQQLAHTFYEYQKLTGSTVSKAIESEMSGDLKKGMLAIAKCVENRPFYFAEMLYKTMKVGLGTDDNTLIRIVVSRCEIDMVQIKAEYERNYGVPLVDSISGDTSGDYKKILIALVNGN